MRKTMILTGLATLSLAGTAIADKPEQTGKPADKPVKAEKPSKPERPSGNKGDSKGKKKGKSKTHFHAFNVHGTLVSHTLALNPDGSVDGTVVVATKKKDKKTKAVVTKETTYTLDDAKLWVRTDDRNGDKKSDLADVKAGDRVKLEGRISHVHGKKRTAGERTVKLRRVKFDDPKPAKPAPAPTPAPTPGS